MKISEKQGGNFTPHPETDDYIRAVIVDITPLKKRMTAFGEKEEFRIVFESELEDEESERRFCIWSRGYTASLDAKAAFRKDLKKIIGRELTSAELASFETEEMIGWGVKIEVIHAHKDDQTYANISSLKPDKTPLKASGKYKRVKDREDSADQPEPAKAQAEPAKKKPAASAGWESVVVHVGKYAGKKLGEVDEGGVAALIERWLPGAKDSKDADDVALSAALAEVAELLGVKQF